VCVCVKLSEIDT